MSEISRIDGAGLSDIPSVDNSDSMSGVSGSAKADDFSAMYAAALKKASEKTAADDNFHERAMDSVFIVKSF